MVRLYMTRLASKARLAKDKRLIVFAVLMTFVCYANGPVGGMLTEYWNQPSIISLCMNDQTKTSDESLPLQHFFVIGLVLMSVAVGLICDVWMYFFVKGWNHGQSSKVSRYL